MLDLLKTDLSKFKIICFKSNQFHNANAVWNHAKYGPIWIR